MSNAAFKIDKGIPIPPKGSGRRLKTGGAFGALEVNDSVFLSNKNQTDINALAKSAIKLGRKFTSRKTAENGVAGVRVWRTE